MKVGDIIIRISGYQRIQYGDYLKVTKITSGKVYGHFLTSPLKEFYIGPVTGKYKVFTKITLKVSEDVYNSITHSPINRSFLFPITMKNGKHLGKTVEKLAETQPNLLEIYTISRKRAVLMLDGAYKVRTRLGELAVKVFFESLIGKYDGKQ